MPPLLRSSRACDPCRAIKVKCDGVYPTCDRCATRGLVCTGLDSFSSGNSIFRNQNEAARRGSERARRGSRRSQRLEHVELNIEAASVASATSAPAATIGADGTAPNEGPEGAHNQGPPHAWPHEEAITAIPEPPRTDAASQAVHRFFDDWLLLKRHDSSSEGHEYELPRLYSATAPGSILSRALKALAFAHVSRRGLIHDSPSALHYYGEALSGLRDLTGNARAFAGDDTLVSLLLVDTFESTFLGRKEPLGSHSAAVLHSLRVRADEQLCGTMRPGFRNSAHLRLQARQLALGEDSTPTQDAWHACLSSGDPGLAASAKIHDMTRFCTSVRKFNRVTGVDPVTKGACAKRLLGQGLYLAESIEELEKQFPAAWRPQEDTTALHKILSLPLPQLRGAAGWQKRVFRTFWYRSQWHLYCAGELMVREAIVELLSFLSLSTLERKVSIAQMAEIRSQQDRIQTSCRSMLLSVQQLAGLVGPDDSPIRASPQGYMMLKMLAFVAMTVVSKSKSALEDQRRASEQIVRGLYPSQA